MSICHDYETLGLIQFHAAKPPIMEAFKGSDIVDWHGRIEQSLVNLKKDAEKANNFTYKNRLEAFLDTWRQHPIDGSLNRETIDTLSAAAMQWAREEWDLQSYFLSLHTRLRQLIASEEELPRGADANQNEPPAGGHGHGAPPMSPEFGPDKEGGDMPGGDEMGGMGGGGDTMGGGPTPPGGQPGAPGAEGASPDGLEGPEGLGAEGANAGQGLDAAPGSDVEGGAPEDENPDELSRL